VDISSRFIGDGYCILSLTVGINRKVVEDWVPGRVVRLSVDRRANLPCGERAMRIGLTTVTTDDVRTAGKVIGKEREEEYDDEGMKEAKERRDLGGYIRGANNAMLARSHACPFPGWSRKAAVGADS